MAPVVFKRLQVNGWRQFDSVDIELHPRLTVITGANGSGKSTLLSMFARHFGWARPFLGVPQQDKYGRVSYDISVFHNILKKRLFEIKYPNQIGLIEYTNNTSAPIGAGSSQAVQYNVDIPFSNQIDGLFVDSHRPTQVYQQVPNISLTAITADQAFAQYNNEMLNRYSGNHYSQSSPMFRMKEAIISMAVFGEGNSQVGYDTHLFGVYNGFNEILKSILPESLGFERLAVRKPEVVLVTKSGEFMIDAASGGISTLIDIAWRIYMYSMDRDQFVVAMDEPENHLHPTMQRSLMRRLLKAFPQAQFIIATHSPFMVSSVKDSSVYVLRYQSVTSDTSISDVIGEFTSSRVVSEKLDNINKASSAAEILREVLGVPATMPEWVEEGLGVITEKYKSKEFSRETLNELRGELASLGYSDYYPDVVSEIAN